MRFQRFFERMDPGTTQSASPVPTRLQCHTAYAMQLHGVGGIPR